jgi:uncharacterized membrane protein
MNTSRVEAFSDGVFAIAITLLILEIKVPDAADGRLAHELLDAWPSFASYAVSFLTIGIIWVNHHAIFRYVAHVDRVVLFLNLGLLATVSFLPFPTALLARYVRDDGSNAHVAAFAYSLTMTLMSVFWSTFWWYLTHHQSVFDASLDHAQAHAIWRQGLLGMAIYAITLAVSWVNAPLTLVVFGGLAVFWVVIYRPESRASAPSPEPATHQH